MHALTILVVDDMRECADTLALLVRIWGHQCAVAHDGATALALVEAQSPDVAILDLAMPGMDGYELGRRLRSMPGLAQLPLIALTAYAEEPDRPRALAAGFAHHLAKPLDPEELETILRAVAMEKTAGRGGGPT
jgi:CheY-like chemotaxis protein